MIYIGVDPGQKGGIAWITTYHDQIGSVHVFPWDDDGFVKAMQELRNIFKDDMVAAVEKVGAMPGQGVTSMFSFGQSFGFILGVLTALGIGYQLVPPRVWKKEYSLTNDKGKSIEVCKRLFPGVDLKRTGRCKTDSDGMAEALLLAEYARRKF